MHPTERDSSVQRGDAFDGGERRAPSGDPRTSTMRAIDCGAGDGASSERPAGRGRGVPRGAPFAGETERPRPLR